MLQRRPYDLERATFFRHVFRLGCDLSPANVAAAARESALYPDTFRRRQLTTRAAGKQPGFHVFVPDVVAGLHLAVALAHFRVHVFWPCGGGVLSRPLAQGCASLIR